MHISESYTFTPICLQYPLMRFSRIDFYVLPAIFMAICILAYATYSEETGPPPEAKEIPFPPMEQYKLIAHVIPDKAYDYWHYKVSDLYTDQYRMTYKGDTTFRALLHRDKTRPTFHVDGLSFTHMVYVNHGKAGYVTNNEELKSFIGKVDNLEEAILIAGMSGFVQDRKQRFANAYLKTAKGYELYLGSFELCPVTNRLFHITIDYSGHLTAKYLRTYYKSGDCIIF